MSELICNVPFCENKKVICKGVGHGMCYKHKHERTKYNMPSFKEVLPLWCVKRCRNHGLLSPRQCLSPVKNSSGSIVYRCRICSREYERNLRNQSHLKDQRKNNALKMSYGITLSDYKEMFESQDGVCAICFTHAEFTKHGRLRSLQVDHCHGTGKVRALLCAKFNMGLGSFNDDLELLQKAIDYLRPHKET